jgi:hypothetical protein
LEGYSVQGISGGTVAPQPASGVAGFFSRAYMTNMTANITNFNDTGGATTTGLTTDLKNRTAATIFWAGANDPIKNFSNSASSTLLLENPGFDRIMTTAEQNEYEARNLADGAAADLSEVLTTGLVPTYCTLWLTLISNYIRETGFDTYPAHRMFMVREPQAFWKYDGTLHWPQGYYQKNEVHKKVADYWSIPLIDLWNNSGINLATRGMFMLEEASGQLFIHINDKGGRQCARFIASEFMRNPVIDFSGTSQGSALGIPTAQADLGPWNPDNVV